MLMYSSPKRRWKDWKTKSSRSRVLREARFGELPLATWGSQVFIWTPWMEPLDCGGLVMADCSSLMLRSPDFLSLLCLAGYGL